MIPVELGTPRLVLDQPTVADRDLIVEYCRDPLFEQFMTLPWPYRPSDADYFLENVVAPGWANDTEYTWALRRDGEFLGVIGYRAERSDLGYWLGAPHRGKGYMREAVACVVQWLREVGVEQLNWECVVGNVASASLARSLGFEYTGERPSELAFRDGSHPLAWHGVLRADGTRNEWPIP